MKFTRFDNLSNMIVFSILRMREASCLIDVDHSVYTDDNGLTYRPQIFLVYRDRRETLCLRWNAFASQPDVSFLGPKAKREANARGEMIAKAIQEKIDEVLS